MVICTPLTDVGLTDSVTFQNGAEKHPRAADVFHKVEIHKVEGTWLPGTGTRVLSYPGALVEVVVLMHTSYPGTDQ